MSTDRERQFLVFMSALGLLSAGVMLLYPPASGDRSLRVALLSVLLVLLIGRFTGAVVAAVAALLSAVTLVLSRGSSASLGIDILLDALTLFMVGASVSGYVRMLRRNEIAALQHEREATLLARLSADLLPPSLQPEALSTLLDEVRSAAAADHVDCFVPGDDGRLGWWAEASSRQGGQRQRALDVAQLVYEAAVADRAAGLPKEGDVSEKAAPLAHGLVTSAADVYVPMVSAAGVEGVLHASRPADGPRWQARDESFLEFAANLVATLIERDRLQDIAMSAKALEEADRLKANIVSSVSHDLKTPLAAVIATVTSLLDDPATGPPVKAELESAYESLGTLGRRIERLVDVSRLETASWRPNLEWNDVHDLCVSACSQLGSAQSRIRCDLPDDMALARFDIVQLSRAIYHLLENALQYSPPGSVVRVSGDSDATHVRLWVEDSGPGIAPDERETIFEKFRRGRAGDEAPGGTGLGLAIVAGIVAVHQGRIEVDAVEPTGARFTVILPIDREGQE